MVVLQSIAVIRATGDRGIIRIAIAVIPARNISGVIIGQVVAVVKRIVVRMMIPANVS